MAWGKRNAPIPIPMTNERERQTYYGALNLLTHEFGVPGANAGKCTVSDEVTRLKLNAKETEQES
jgi:hypothetical protein